MAIRRLYILGTSGLAKELAQLAFELIGQGSRWEFGGFVGDSKEAVGHDLGFGLVVGDDDWLLAQEGPADVIVGIGYPSIRAKVVEKYRTDSRFAFPNLVHARALVDHNRVRLGVGNVITAGCLFTCDIEVADFNLFNLGSTIGHDVRVGSSSVVNPGANVSGAVTIGNGVLVGTGAQILQGCTVADGATVGAGAVVTKDVPEGITVVGVPARPLSKG